MTKEKTIDAGNSRDQLADELLSDDELDNVAGGTGCKGRGEFPIDEWGIPPYGAGNSKMK